MDNFLEGIIDEKPKKKRNCLHFLKYRYLKFIRSNIFQGFLKFIGVIFFLILVLFLWTSVSNWYDYNIRYSIAMPQIAGYFIKKEYGFSASGMYVISTKEKNDGEKSASLLFGEINCDYSTKSCKEELVSVMNIAGIYMFPYVKEYDILYRDKNRIIYGNYDTISTLVDLNQETITRTVTKTFLQDKPKKQTDEFITDYAEIAKETKRVTRKFLKRKLF